MKKYIHLYDTSNYKEDNFLYSLENKKVLGKVQIHTLEPTTFNVAWAGIEPATFF